MVRFRRVRLLTLPSVRARTPGCLMEQADMTFCTSGSIIAKHTGTRNIMQSIKLYQRYYTIRIQRSIEALFSSSRSAMPYDWVMCTNTS
jgi:hypothetical protein